MTDTVHFAYEGESSAQPGHALVALSSFALDEIRAALAFYHAKHCDGGTTPAKRQELLDQINPAMAAHERAVRLAAAKDEDRPLLFVKLDGFDIGVPLTMFQVTGLHTVLSQSEDTVERLSNLNDIARASRVQGYTAEFAAKTHLSLAESKDDPTALLASAHRLIERITPDLDVEVEATHDWTWVAICKLEGGARGRYNAQALLDAYMSLMERAMVSPQPQAA
jgi:hypothetical protein